MNCLEKLKNFYIDRDKDKLIWIFWDYIEIYKR